MFRAFVLTLVLALAAVVWLQGQRMARLEALLAAQDERVEEVSARQRPDWLYHG